MRELALTFATLVAVAPALAQEGHDHQRGARQNGEVPEGWHVRLDRATASMEEVDFVEMGDGYHITLGPAGIFYDPDNVLDGDFRVHATFTQTRAAEHPEAYGLFAGGRDLEADNQDYLYFLIRQDGRFLVKHRAGSETHTLIDWTTHEAVEEVGDRGRATNTLTIEAHPDGARFLVNGIEVAALPRAPQLNTDGIVGFRVNHNLDLHIAGFQIERLDRS